MKSLFDGHQIYNGLITLRLEAAEIDFTIRI